MFLAWFNNSSLILQKKIIFQGNLGSKGTNNIAFSHSLQYSIEIILPLLILVYSLLNLQNQLEAKKVLPLSYYAQSILATDIFEVCSSYIYKLEFLKLTSRI